METAGEERIRAAESLQKLEEAALLLEEASKSHSIDKVSTGFPDRVSTTLNSLTALSSRDDAERLLALGVSMWNSVIAFEGCEQSEKTIEALVKVRHVAVDCMYMSTSALGGISARYNIDDISLLKFYTVCGQKYATDLSDVEMAEICFSRAAEFVETAINEVGGQEGGKKNFSSAMFDLLVGRAECAWERGDSDQAERFVSDARSYMDDLCGEHEFLASVEYNFGLYAYQAKETERALKWLKKSMETRESISNSDKDLRKQAKTARLAGVCLLALQRYEESWEMMHEAEKMAHDPIGSYLLLKLSVISQKPEALDTLLNVVADAETNLDVCLASIALFGDAQRISDAAIGYEHLFARYRDDPHALVSHVGLKHFETLSTLGRIDDALGVLEVCKDAFEKIESSNGKHQNSTGAGSQNEDLSSHFSKWSALLLATGCAQADGKKYASAAKILKSCLLFSRSSRVSSCVVLENETAVCRLASSCALCALEELRKEGKVSQLPAVSEGDSREQVVTKDELWRLCLDHAERAKQLEPSDFAPRLLLFRAFLIAGEAQRAADELRVASMEISSFDPGALAEAACAAKDVGSMPSIVAALRCIIKMDPTALHKHASRKSQNVPKGFLGKVLLSCVHILIEAEGTEPGDQQGTMNTTQGTHSAKEKNAELQDIMRSGLGGIRKLGVEVAFGKEKDDVCSSLQYLIDTCWNKGRECGMNSDYSSWEAFFDVCYELSLFLPAEAENLHTQRVSKLMCASALIENPESSSEGFVRARQHLAVSQGLTEQLHEVSPRSDEDPIEALLLLLDARCCVGSADIDSLANVVETALKKKYIPAPVFEQIAAVCYTYGTTESTPSKGDIARCMDFTCALLRKATDARLCQNPRDMAAIAVTIREHLGIELSRGSTAARAYQVFSKAVGIAMENDAEYPSDERRWLIATGWDRAQMFKRLGLRSEARRWCEEVRKMAEGCAAFATYIPRITSLLESL